MAADLTIPGTTGRKSFLLMDDALVMLEHGGMRDRVTKILYEHIETILVWKKMPWIKIILTAVFLGGLALLFLREAEKGNEAFRTSAEILAAALIVAEAVIIIMKTTYLRIIHEGAVFEVSMSVFPWQINKFVRKVKEKAELKQLHVREIRDKAAESA